MAKIRLLWNNLIDVAALAASSEAAGFEVENVVDERFLKAWRSAGVDESVVIDLSALATLDKSVRAWAIRYHNLVLASGDQYKIQGSAGDLSGSGSPGVGEVDDDFTPTPDIVVGFFDAVKDFDFWKFILDSSGSKGAGEYQRIGRLFLGNYFEPTFDVTSKAISEVDDSEILASRQGQEFANIVAPYETIAYAWEALPAADIATMKTIYQTIGQHTPFFICEDAATLAGAYTVTRYVKNIEPWTFSPVTNGWGSVVIRVKTER